MNAELRAKLHAVADTLRWVGEQLDKAAEGDGEAASYVRCFCRDWCGMVAIGPAVLAPDMEDVFAEAEAYTAEFLSQIPE